MKLYWVTGSTQLLAFTGVVSDPVWNAEDRTITVSATGDLQSKLDAMSKTAIASLVGGSFSEYIFDDPDNMSGYDYAEARVSTTANVLWQDAQGWIRTTSVLAKASADYTFTNSTILDAARVVRWQGRMDSINTLYLTLGYRTSAVARDGSSSTFGRGSSRRRRPTCPATKADGSCRNAA